MVSVDRSALGGQTMRKKHLTTRAPASDGVARFERNSFDAPSALWFDVTTPAYNGEDHTGGTWPAFDGVGDYVVAPAPYAETGVDALPITADLTSVTMECWAKPAGLTANSRLISINSDTTTGYLLISLRTTGELRCYVNNSNKAQSALGVVTVGPWFHVVMTAGTGVAPAIYLDGADVTLATTASSYAQSNTQIAAGATLYNPTPSTTQRFYGDLDTVRVYDRILSPDEVLANYNAGKAAHP
tara:strand:+ start:61 stop:789 length:729 start_codon:yes stop_codon:yes gene_type:complete